MGPLNKPEPNLRTKPSATSDFPLLFFFKEFLKTGILMFPFCLARNSFPAENTELTGLWHTSSAGGKA